VPLTGSAASRAGEEIAHCISGTTGADVTFLHVVTREEDASTESRPAAAPPSARAVLTQAQQAAAEKDIDVDVVVRHATSSAKQIQREAERIDADIVVMGTTVRRVDGRPFLGHTVEHILQRLCDPTVVVVALPDAQQMTAGEHIDRRAG
jgi:nucleotide-binding universal stress UspA family protein